jgi:DNA-binding transcriptional MerR regulator
VAQARTPRGSRSRRTPSDVRLVKISQLAEESGVPGPTIKHYLREGLLSGPARRTSRNMAYYDARLAARVKVIKELQAERFLPLRVIGDLLEPSPSAKLREDLDRAERQKLGELAPAVRDGLSRSGQLSRDELDWLDRIDLVNPEAVDGVPTYRGVHLELLGVLADIRRAGLGDVFPVSLVEPYVAAIRALVRLEIDLFRRRVMDSGAVLPKSLPDVANFMVEIGQRLMVGLRAKLLPPELEAMLPS